MSTTEDGIVIAHTVRVWGNRGEVAAEILTEFPERFADVTQVVLRRGRDERVATLEGHRFHKGRVLLKFSGSETISDAEKLAGFDVVIPEDDLYERPDDDFFYEFELVGSDVVTERGEAVGTVEGILRTAAGEILTVRRADGREALIPFVDEICVEVDPDEKRIVVDPPEGLLEL